MCNGDGGVLVEIVRTDSPARSPPIVVSEEFSYCRMVTTLKWRRRLIVVRIVGDGKYSCLGNHFV